MSTWVLLRGLARDRRHWENFPQMLRQALPQDARVIALDLPGNGSHAGETSPLSVGRMVDAYREQLRADLPLTDVNLLGLSLGAMVAVEWAARHPRELASAVLVNGSAARLSGARLRLRPRAGWELLMAAAHRLPAERERRIVSICTNIADAETAARRWASYAAAAQTRGPNVLRQLVAAACWPLPTEKPSVPMLVLAAAADRLASVECSIAIARHWNLPIVLHPSAGHELALDDPAWLVRQCARWCGGP